MTTLYARYLVADQIIKRMESVGAKLGTIFFTHADEVHISLDYGSWREPGTAYDSPENREAIVNDFLTRYPDSTISREKDYSGKPQMIVRGETRQGIKWQIDFREGVCERVQVGTKKVEQVDPELYRTLPRVMVEEPVYEYMCADPIAQAGMVSA